MSPRPYSAIPVERLLSGTRRSPDMTFRACSVHGCGKDARTSARGARGYCSAHLQRLYRHGDPLGGKTLPEYKLEYFWKAVVPHQGDRCLFWPFREGYPSITIDGAYTAVHRAACVQVHGEAPTPKHEVAHNCGKGHLACVNPRHLRWATHAENLGDTVIHGTSVRGERKRSSRLVEADIPVIRSLRDTLNNRQIAERFSVSRACIHSVLVGRSWSWVK